MRARPKLPIMRRTPLLLPALTTVACTLLAPDEAGLSAGEPPCMPGQVRCGSTCGSVLDPAFGCGTCAPCALDHATAMCAADGCAIAKCAQGFEDCDGRSDNGCEADLKGASTCGRCGQRCGNDTPLCSEGSCVPRCRAIELTAAKAHLEAPSDGWAAIGKGDFTLELWLQRHGKFTVLDEGTILHQYGFFYLVFPYTTTGTFFELHPYGAPTLRAAFPSDGAWHHLAITRRATRLTIWLDGTVAVEREGGTFELTPSRTPLAFGAASRSAPAAAIRLGPMRLSSTLRYEAPFTPRTWWRVDTRTVSQWLTTRPFDGVQVLDEAGGDNTATLPSYIESWTESSPCP